MSPLRILMFGALLAPLPACEGWHRSEDDAPPPASSSPRPGADAFEQIGYIGGLGGDGDVRPAGERLGEFCGVAVHSNGGEVGDVSAVGQYGFQWQCTELAYRFVCERLVDCPADAGLLYGDAWKWFENRRAHPVLARLRRFANGGAERPAPGDIIVFGDAYGRWGHLAIVRRVEDGHVVVAEQNHTGTPADAARPIALRSDDGWHIAGALGWLRGPDGFDADACARATTESSCAFGGQRPAQAQLTLRRSHTALVAQVTFDLSGQHAGGVYDLVPVDAAGARVESAQYDAATWDTPSRIAQLAVPSGCGGACSLTFDFRIAAGPPGGRPFRVRLARPDAGVGPCPEASWFVSSVRESIAAAGRDHARFGDAPSRHVDRRDGFTQLKSHGWLEYDLRIPEDNVLHPDRAPLCYALEVDISNSAGRVPGRATFEATVDGGRTRTARTTLTGERQRVGFEPWCLHPGTRTVRIAWTGGRSGWDGEDGGDVNLRVHHVALDELAHVSAD